MKPTAPQIRTHHSSRLCIGVVRVKTLNGIHRSPVVATIVLMLFACAGTAIAQTTWHVPADFPTIQQAIDAATDGDEVLVAPGTYSETIDFDGKAIHLRSQSGPANTIIDGQNTGTVVVCQNGEGPGTIFEGFTITGGNGGFGGGMRNHGSSPTIHNCWFVDNLAAWGGAMDNDNAAPTISDCKFAQNEATISGGAIGNSSNSAPWISSSEFVGNYALGSNGGAMENVASNPVVTDCLFDQNFADDGGAIYNFNSDPTISGSTFSRNTAWSGSGLGGAIRNAGSSLPPVDTSLFCDNSPNHIYPPTQWIDGGGNDFLAICHVVVRVPIDYATIQAAIDAVPSTGAEILVADGTYNETLNFHGKAIHLRSENGPTETTIDAQGAGVVITCANGEGPDTIIEGFTITGGSGVLGGGMRNDGSSPTVINCHFLNNFGVWGGAIDNNNGSNPNIVNCRFINNTADHGGGALSNYNNSNPTITDSLFLDNSAFMWRGGAIENVNSHTIVTGSFFLNNDAPSGGAVYLQNSDATEFDQSIFFGNIAFDGGAVFNQDSNPTLTECEFRDNEATAGSGGAMFNSGVSFPLIGDTLFCENTPDPIAPAGQWVDGGGNELLAVCPSRVAFAVPNYFSTIQSAIQMLPSGVMIVVADGTYIETIDFLGKAIHLVSENGPAATVIQAPGPGLPVVTFASGEGPDAIIEGFTITGGDAVFGGGMYISSSDPTVENCRFVNNQAELTGGGMYVISGGPFIRDCHFIDNTVLLGGGGGMGNIDAHPVLIGCQFIGNSAFVGGAMQNSSLSAPFVDDCGFLNNSATAAGGAVVNHSSFPIFVNTWFTDNQADLGGAIHNIQSGVIAGDSDFERNIATSGGAIYSTDSSSLTLTNCSFAENIALDSGGGMYSEDTFVFVTESSFVENSAFDGAGMSNINSEVTAEGVTFHLNIADGYGGGVYNVQTIASFITSPAPTSRKCLFDANEAESGGGMFNSAVSVVDLHETRFEHNTAVLDGGAMMNDISIVDIFDSRFENNASLTMFAGAIYNGGLLLAIDGSWFCGNTPAHIFPFGRAYAANNTFLTLCPVPPSPSTSSPSMSHVNPP